MSRLPQPPIRGARFDLFEDHEGMVATVELKKSESGMTSYWWVTGLNCSHQLVCLLQMQLNAPSDIETNPEDWCSSMLETHVIAIARLAKSQMAHGQMLPMLDSQFRARLASAHLERHEKLGHLDSNIVQRAALMYQLASSLGVGTVVEFLASYEEVSTPTMRGRITRARDEGLLEKKRRDTRLGTTKGAAHKPSN